MVEGKRKAAFNDNEYIYHEKVPEKDSLPPIKGASLVKGIPFSTTDPDVAGPDVFARLVPLRAHEASSMYRSVGKIDICWQSPSINFVSVRKRQSCFGELAHRWMKRTQNSMRSWPLCSWTP